MGVQAMDMFSQEFSSAQDADLAAAAAPSTRHDYLRDRLPIHLREAQIEIEAIARSYGLDFPTIIYEMIDSDSMSIIAARGGFPVRYPHYRFAIEYERISTEYTFGASKIYEMVINTDPVYAYLMRSNSDLDQKFVMAHVCGHADFFKHNIYFAHTDRRAMDTMANHASRISQYIEQHGISEVERFIDTALSLEDLIDPQSVWQTEAPHSNDMLDQKKPEEDLALNRLPTSNPYMEKFINPPEILQAERDRLLNDRANKKGSFPSEPQRDVLQFLIENAPLDEWQRDILGIIREEAYYFLPQRQTKILNEGWASYWHEKQMVNHICDSSSIVDFSQTHAGIVQPFRKQINPYRLGIELLREIEDRWNRGCFGREYEECLDQEERKNWDRKLGLGMQKLFEVRSLYSDIAAIREFFDEEFCVRHGYYVYRTDPYTGHQIVEDNDFESVHAGLVAALSNGGRPIHRVTNANFRNRSELLLQHEFTGLELDQEYAQGVLENLFKIWKRPVAVATAVGEDDPQAVILRFDGSKHSVEKVFK